MFLTCQKRIAIKPFRPRKKFIEQADVLLIRHAVSNFNYLKCAIENYFGPTTSKIKRELTK